MQYHTLQTYVYITYHFILPNLKSFVSQLFVNILFEYYSYLLTVYIYMRYNNIVDRNINIYSSIRFAKKNYLHILRRKLYFFSYK